MAVYLFSKVVDDIAQDPENNERPEQVLKDDCASTASQAKVTWYDHVTRGGGAHRTLLRTQGRLAHREGLGLGDVTGHGFRRFLPSLGFLCGIDLEDAFFFGMWPGGS